MIKYTATHEEHFQPELDKPYIFCSLQDLLHSCDLSYHCSDGSCFKNVLLNLVDLFVPDNLKPKNNEPASNEYNAKLIEIAYMLMHRWFYSRYKNTDWQKEVNSTKNKSTKNKINSLLEAQRFDIKHDSNFVINDSPPETVLNTLQELTKQYMNSTDAINFLSRPDKNKLLAEQLQVLRNNNVSIAGVCDLVICYMNRALGLDQFNTIMKNAYKLSRDLIRQKCKEFVLNNILNAQNGDEVIVQDQKGWIICTGCVRHPFQRTNSGEIDLSQPCFVGQDITPNGLINAFFNAITADTNVTTLINFHPTDTQPIIPLPNISLTVSFSKKIEQSKNPVPTYIHNPFYQSHQLNQYGQNNPKHPQKNNIDYQNEEYYLGQEDEDYLNQNEKQEDYLSPEDQPPYNQNSNDKDESGTIKEAFIYNVKKPEEQKSGQGSRQDVNSIKEESVIQEEDSAGVQALKRWIITGNTTGLNRINYSDLVDFVIQAENDQCARTNPDSNLPKDTDDIFNRGTSWWFRSNKKKRADYLYRLIEEQINTVLEDRITIRDKKNQAKRNDELKRRINRAYSNNGATIQNRQPVQSLNNLKDRLKEYHPGCCCCC